MELGLFRISITQLLVILLVPAIVGNYFGIMVLMGIFVLPFDALLSAWVILAVPKILFVIVFAYWVIGRMRPKVIPSR